ncbi:gamma-glutamyl-gamma-aminobutyrate hydrolase family protein [Liquorilactobacillus mali]|uniref:gamma-glutamyl-gamma-aminobutyrate hydrolase family protein n=1 Tax=Liquorilactobacillus mali TaxID=1618 RepID=UPI002953B040|nr:gamma-glutamyl-gamma-aminobutyrate hydrolase family protein [Liquorilactobacillus mali]MDV7757294.1 gamma-glutamyl-gamma-aminobutyrate hydrolase family protein [Liquorilactobacillus mali]
MKPIIGMPSDQLIETNPRMPGDYLAYAPHDVKEAIYAAGGIPIILPFPEKFDDVEDSIQDIVAMIDGLMLPGGPDVDPLFYGEEPILEIGMTIGIEDKFEIALIKEVIRVGKPILGICRGIQVLNVALGGTLYQDLEAQNPNVKIQHAQATLGHFKTHHVKIEENSRLSSLLGDNSLVNSRHHQAIKQVAEGLTVAAISPDGIVEAVESENSNQILAVQWHPENLWQNDKEQFKLFTDFVERSVIKK